MIRNHLTIGMLGCAAAGIVFIASMIWNLQPDRHFVSKDYPVLAMPSPSKEEIPNDGSSYSFQLHHEQQTRNDFVSRVQNAVSEPSKNTDSKESHAFNALLLGIDAEGSEGSRSDVILLVHVIPASKKAAIISVPHDTRVKLAGIGETKINHDHTVGQTKGGGKKGSEAVIQAVSDLFQIPIHYYAKTDFKGFLESDRLPELPELIAKIKKDVVETNFSDSDLICLAFLFRGNESRSN